MRILQSSEQNNRELVSNKKFLLQTQLASQIGSWQMDSDFQVTNLTPQTYRNMGLDITREQMSYADFIDQINETDRRLLLNKIVSGQHNLKTFEHNCRVQVLHEVKIIELLRRH